MMSPRVGAAGSASAVVFAARGSNGAAGFHSARCYEPMRAGDASNRRDAPAPPAVDRSNRIRMTCNVDERIEPILKPDARGVAEDATRIAARLPGSRTA